MQLVCVTGPPRPVRPGDDSTQARVDQRGVEQTGVDRRGDLEARLGELNARLLHALGGNWDDPPPLADGWHNDSVLAPLRDEAARVLDTADHDWLVWEDPRTGILAPFWDAVASVRATGVVVLAPDEVVHHLVDATGTSVQAAAELWLRYTVTAWRSAPARIVICPGVPGYDPAAVLRRLAELTRGDVDEDAMRAAIARCLHGAGHVVQPPLTVGGMVGGPRLDLARAVYDVMVAAPDAQVAPFLDALHAGWLAAARSARAQRIADVATRVEREERQRAVRLQADVDQLRVQLREAETRWAGTARDAKVGEEELARQRQHLQGELHRLQRQVEEAYRDYDRLRRRRAVRLALAVAEVARPVVRRYRARRRRSEVARPLVRRYRARRRRPSAAPVEPLPQPTARVFTIILNYRHVDDTLRCIESLRASTHRNQVPVVVDNGSGEQALAALRQGLGARALLDAGRNLGYAAGNNVGIRYALDRDADFVWLLNPDTRVEPDTLTRLLATMAELPDCGVLGARVLTGGSEPVTIESDGGLIDWQRAGAASHRSVGQPDRDIPTAAPHPVDYVTGACMLVRRALFDHVGLLPEEWFLYFEETEFNVRAAEAGWRVLVDPRARVWHHKRSSGRLPSPYYVYYFVRNRLLFARRRASYGSDDPPADLHAWLDAWRAKVAAADDAWLPTFDKLVGWAIEDARAGVDGPRAEVETVEPGGVGGASG